MEYNTNKEKWIGEVLESTKGMSRAPLRIDLYENIIRNLDNSGPVKNVRIPARQWVAAAVLLLAINAGSVIYYTVQNKKTSVTASANPIALEIQSASTYNY